MKGPEKSEKQERAPSPFEGLEPEPLPITFSIPLPLGPEDFEDCHGKICQGYVTFKEANLPIIKRNQVT
jgi:hypothetical protein